MEPPQHLTLGIALVILLAATLARSQDASQIRQDHTGTATVRGTVTVSSKTAAVGRQTHDPMRERYPTHSTSDDVQIAGQHPADVWRLSERVVVYLDNSLVDRQTYPAPEKHPVLDQKNLEFHPRVLPVLIGSTVDFPNRDNLFHNVFSYSRTKEFDLGRYPRNDSRSVTFDEPGVVRVYCDIHSHMNATILVLQNPYFAVPADDGTYAIRHVPEGKYTLVVWYDRDIVERRPVVVKAGEILEQNFTF